MARQLSEGDIVELIQNSLSDGAFAVAHFSRDREYSYLSFVNLNDMLAFLLQKDVDDVWINQDPRTLYFLIDEWFIFANGELANHALEATRQILNANLED